MEETLLKDMMPWKAWRHYLMLYIEMNVLSMFEEKFEKTRFEFTK